MVWAATERRSEEGPALDLKYVSRDGEEGYPGTLTVAVTYKLTNENELKIDYSIIPISRRRFSGRANSTRKRRLTGLRQASDHAMTASCFIRNLPAGSSLDNSPIRFARIPEPISRRSNRPRYFPDANLLWIHLSESASRRLRIASQTVSNTLTRAYHLQLDSTIVHGACGVVVRCNIS